jgi:hypothetical protein
VKKDFPTSGRIVVLAHSSSSSSSGVGTEWSLAHMNRLAITRVTHKIILRWRADLTQDMRLRHHNRYFLILAIWDQDEQKRFLVCLCEEVKE